MKKNNITFKALFTMVCFFIMRGVAFAAADPSKLCTDSSNAGIVKAFQIVGYALFVLKIVAPIALIIVGSISIGKAVVSGDNKAINQSIGNLIKKAIAAVVIFFIPTIVSFVISLVDGATNDVKKFDCLTNCVQQPKSCAIPSNNLFK